MNILFVTGSRGDNGLLAWPEKMLDESGFDTPSLHLWGATVDTAFVKSTIAYDAIKPDVVLLLGDRFEILSAALAAHLKRIPIAHLAGGDISRGSYDDAMRDCISRLASLHFPTSHSSAARLVAMGFHNVHMVGSTGVDYILNADWKKARTILEPYVVVAYYPETIDGTVDLESVRKAINGRKAIWITPNPDAGVEKIPQGESFTHDEFLNLISYCDEFIGNSSAILYEAPFLGVKTRLIGKRQEGRVVPFGDGKASERIRDILKGKTWLS